MSATTFSPSQGRSMALTKSANIVAINNTGADIVRGTPVAFRASDESAIAISTAAIANQNEIMVAMDDTPMGKSGRFAFAGEVFVLVNPAVTAGDTLLMPAISATGGLPLIAFASGGTPANRSCAITKEAGIANVPTRVMMGGRSSV